MLRLGVQPQGRFGDHPERAFRTDERLQQIRARSVVRDRQRRDGLTGRHDRFDLQRHVFDLAVLGGNNARTACRKRATDRRAEVVGPRIVREREPATVEFPFKDGPVNSRLHGHCQARFIDVDDPVHAGQVERNPPVERERAALGPGAAPARYDRNPVLRCDPHYRFYLAGRLRPHEQVSSWQWQVAVTQVLRHP